MGMESGWIPAGKWIGDPYGLRGKQKRAECNNGLVSNKKLQSTVVQHNATKTTNAKWSPILKMQMDQFFETSMHQHSE